MSVAHTPMPTQLSRGEFSLGGPNPFDVVFSRRHQFSGRWRMGFFEIL